MADFSSIVGCEGYLVDISHIIRHGDRFRQSTVSEDQFHDIRTRCSVSKFRFEMAD
jgi:hypothetical protein